MEALPRMIMIAPQFRTSQWTYDNIPKFDFRTRVKEYILMHFQADPHAYDEAFNDLANMKFECNNPTASIEMSCVLKRYFGQLCMIQKRFPMSPGQELETPFAWYDSFLESRSNNEISYNDVEFEKASVMFNIGAVHAQIAVQESRESQDSIKNAFMHFQYAASAFEKLRNEKFEDAFYPSADLDPQVLEFMQRIMIAQAQECLVQKSLLDNRTPVVIAKLAKWLHEEYESCAKLVEEWNVNLSDRIQRYNMKVCQLKSSIYGTIAFLSLGDHAEVEMKKMGHRLAYFNIAQKILNALIKEKSLADKYPEFISTISFLGDVVQAKQANAEKENNFIYHERVPKEEELQEELKGTGPFSSMCKAKPLAFDPLDRSVCGDDIFGTLLPATVLQSVSVYEEKKSQIKRDILEELFQANQELDVFLGKAGYTDLRWMLNEGKDSEKMFALPDILLERNAELTAQPDAIPALLERLRESSDSSRIAEAKLNTLIAKLRAIDLPRLKNDEGYVLISKELERLHEHLVNAKANNVSLNKAIAAHSTNLQILSLPLYELKSKLLPENCANISRTVTSKEEIALKKVMDKIEEMRSQRDKLMKQLEDDLQKDDISKELLAQRDFSHDDVFESQLKKHDDTIRYIRMNICAQDNILHAFTEANADFCDERLQINQGTEKFNEQIMVLVTAYDIFKDVGLKVTDGEKFYRQLMQRCEQFAVPIHAMEEQYKEEMEKRNREKRELEERHQAMRRQRETRDTMAEFGMMPGAPSAIGVYPPPLQTPSQNGAPKLRDFLDEYRNRKAAPPSIPNSALQYPMTPMADEPPAAPPSPTPSSVNEFPISPSVGHFGRRPGAPYIPPKGHQRLPFMGPPESVSRTSTPSQEQQQQQQQYYGGYYNPTGQSNQTYPCFAGNGMASPQTYSSAAPPTLNTVVSSSMSSASIPSYPPPPPQNPTQNPMSSNQGMQTQNPMPSVSNHQISHQNSMSSLSSNGTNQQNPMMMMMSLNQGILPQNPISSMSNSGINHQNPMMMASNQGMQTQNPISPASSFPSPQNPMSSSSSIPSTQSIPSYPMMTPSNQGIPPQNPMSSSSSNPPIPNYPVSNQAMMPHNSFAPAATNPPPQNHGIASSIASPLNTASINPYQQHSQYRAAPQQQQQQHQKPETPILTQAPPPPPPQATPSPTPTQFSGFRGAAPVEYSRGASTTSPWHATPNQASPWHVQTSAPQPPPPTQQQNTPIVPPTTIVNQNQNQNQPKSNVDLLSDLLGDFNLPPPLQPSVQNVQNVQKPDFPTATMPTGPDKRSAPRPAATVMPMPQQSVATSPMDVQPILSMNCASSVSFQAPFNNMSDGGGGGAGGKFEIGNGDRQKLEKRMLHHSIRTNGPAPPLDLSDPLNQIDPFQIVNRK